MAASGWDAFWHSVASFAQDVWHAIKKGVMKVVNAVVTDIKKGIIQLTIALEGIGQAVMNFVIKTIDDVQHAVQTAFKWIEVEVEDAINWLKSVFNWNDILATKEVIKGFIDYSLSYLVNNSNPQSPNSFQNFINGKFASLVDEVKGINGPSIFDQMNTAVVGKSINGYLGTLPQVSPVLGGGKSILEPANLHKQTRQHQVRSNYVQHKLSSFYNRGGKLPLSGSAALQANPLTTTLDAFMSAIKDTMDWTSGELRTQLIDLAKGLQEHYSIQNDFFDIAIDAIVDLVKGVMLFILDLIDKLIIEILNFAHQGLEIVQNVLTYSLDIPVISWLYKEISHDDLNLVDLFSLVVAVPTTVLYKTLWGGKQFLPPFTTDPNRDGIAHVQDILGKLPSIKLVEGKIQFEEKIQLSAAQTASTEPEGEENSGKILLGIVGLLYSLILASADILSDLDIPEKELPEGLPATLFGWVSIVCECIDFAINVPYEEMGKAERSEAENWLIGLWAVGALGPILEIIVVVLGKKAKNAAEEEELEKLEPAITALGGLARLLIGIIATVKFAQDENKDVGVTESITGIIAPIPSIAAPLSYIPNEVTIAIKVVLDFLCDVGAGVCGLIGDTKD